MKKMGLSISVLMFLLINFLSGSNSASLDWSMYRHDQSHSGFSTSPAPDTAFLLGIYDMKRDKYSSPIVSGKKIYITGNNLGVVSIDMDTGSEIWTYPHATKYGNPAIEYNKLFVGGGPNFVGLDKNSGKLIWESEIGGFIGSSPIIVDEKIFVGTGAPARSFHANYDDWNRIVALDKFTGETIWEFKTDGIVSTSPAYLNGIIIAMAEDMSPSEGGYAYALDASTGKLIWKLELSLTPSSSPVIYKDRVFLVSGKTFNSSEDLGKVYCIDLYSGERIWTYDIERDSVEPAVGYEMMFLSNSNSVLSLDPRNGEEIWKFELDKEEKLTSPSIADGKVFFGSDEKRVFALDAFTGREIWVFETRDTILSSPVIANEMIFFISENGRIYVFGIDPETYIDKAEKYLKDKDYGLSRKFYLRARDYYEEKGNQEKINICEEKLKIIESEIEILTQEEIERFERRNEGERYLIKGKDYLFTKEHEKAIESFEIAKSIFQEIDFKEGIEECNNLIEYAKRKMEEDVEIGKTVFEKIKSIKMYLLYLVVIIVIILLIYFIKINKKKI